MSTVSTGRAARARPGPTPDEPPGETEPDSPAPGLRPPRQERSRRTLRRIVDAALELVEERGVQGASVQAIVERAESSVGSFYARFEGKAELLRYLEHRVWSEARERWDAAVAEGSWSDASLDDLVEGLVRLTLRIERTELTRRGLGLGRERRDEAGSEAEPVAEAGAFRRHIAGDVRRLLLGRRDEIDHPDPERAVEVLFRVLLGAPRPGGASGSFLADGQPCDAAAADAPGELDEESLATELTRMALAYLGRTDPAGDREEKAMDFFDVWG